MHVVKLPRTASTFIDPTTTSLFNKKIYFSLLYNLKINFDKTQSFKRENLSMKTILIIFVKLKRNDSKTLKRSNCEHHNTEEVCLTFMSQSL